MIVSEYNITELYLQNMFSETVVQVAMMWNVRKVVTSERIILGNSSKNVGRNNHLKDGDNGH